MRGFDLTPLFRSTVGFDRLADLLDATARVDLAAFAYPPYNIEKVGEDNYRVTMAVAGFSDKDIEITAQDRTLLISGKSEKDETNTQYLHRGIAARAFERRFELADHIRVAGASLVNGLLHVDLVHEVPEAKRPRTVAISTTAQAQPKVETVENKAAA